MSHIHIARTRLPSSRIQKVGGEQTAAERWAGCKRLQETVDDLFRFGVDTMMAERFLQVPEEIPLRFGTHRPGIGWRDRQGRTVRKRTIDRRDDLRPLGRVKEA